VASFTIPAIPLSVCASAIAAVATTSTTATAHVRIDHLRRNVIVFSNEELRNGSRASVAAHTAIDVPVSPRSARSHCLPMFIEFFSFAAIDDEEQKC
jgi:hypothetical protein